MSFFENAFSKIAEAAQSAQQTFESARDDAATVLLATDWQSTRGAVPTTSLQKKPQKQTGDARVLQRQLEDQANRFLNDQNPTQSLKNWLQLLSNKESQRPIYLYEKQNEQRVHLTYHQVFLKSKSLEFCLSSLARSSYGRKLWNNLNQNVESATEKKVVSKKENKKKKIEKKSSKEEKEKEEVFGAKEQTQTPKSASSSSSAAMPQEESSTETQNEIEIEIIRNDELEASQNFKLALLDLLELCLLGDKTTWEQLLNALFQTHVTTDERMFDQQVAEAPLRAISILKLNWIAALSETSIANWENMRDEISEGLMKQAVWSTSANSSESQKLRQNYDMLCERSAERLTVAGLMKRQQEQRVIAATRLKKDEERCKEELSGMGQKLENNAEKLVGVRNLCIQSASELSQAMEEMSDQFEADMATVRVERSDAQRELQDAMRVEQDLQKQLDDAKQKVRRCQEKKESLKLREGRMRGTMERSKMSSRDDLRGHELAVQLAQQSQEGLLSAKKILEKKKKEIIKIVEKSTESWQKKASEGAALQDALKHLEMVYRHTNWLYKSADAESWDDSVRVSLDELEKAHATATEKYSPYFATLGRRALVEGSFEPSPKASSIETNKIGSRSNFVSETRDTYSNSDGEETFARAEPTDSSNVSPVMVSTNPMMPDDLDEGDGLIEAKDIKLGNSPTGVDGI